MLQNFLITALRNFRKNKFYVFVNILGLGIGIMCCLVLYAILRHELTFDHFHSKKENIYRVVRHTQTEKGIVYSGMLSNPMGRYLYDNKSLIRDVIYMHGPQRSNIEVTYNQQFQIFPESGILFTNSAFLQNLDFPIQMGHDAAALDEPNKVFLSERLAEKFFGKDNPIGQFITYDEVHKLEVVGVLENPPTNTNTPFQMLVSYSTMLTGDHDWLDSWDSYSAASTYVVANEGDNPGELTQEIHKIAEPHLGEYMKERISFHLQPLLDIHTNDLYEGNSTYILPSEVLFGSVALVAVILLISTLNFINLATAQAVKRSREVGIRKTLGSSRGKLVYQFLTETFVLVFIAAMLAFTLGQIAIEQLNGFVEGVSFEIGFDLLVVLFVIPLLIVVTLLAGIYPAFILSGFSPVMAIHNQVSLTRASGKFSLRRGMVIFQFGIANLLIILTIIVSSQMRMVRTADLGFSKENVYTIRIPDRMVSDGEALKTELKGLNFVENACRSLSTPTGTWNWSGSFEIIGKPQTEAMHANVKPVDEDFIELYQIPLVEGRNLTSTYFSDTTLQLLVTRDFLKKAEIHADSALGTTVDVFGWKGKIIGVIEDFNAYALQQPIHPVILTYSPEDLLRLSLKLNSKVTDQQFAQIKEVFHSYGPNELFTMTELSDDLQRFYRLENTIYRAFQIFAFLAILIAVFGLYGLVSFMSEVNRKNIGIRKIFGAGIANILRIFGKEYVLLLILSFCFACPLAYWIANEWLNGFAYRIDISLPYFALTLLIVTLIALFTVGYKSYKAAMANPIDSLRHE